MHILAANPDAIGDFVLREPMYTAILKAGHKLTLVVRSQVAPLASLVAPSADILTLHVNPYAEFFDISSPEVQRLLQRARGVCAHRILIASYQWTAFEQALVAALPATPIVRLTGVCFPSGNRELGGSDLEHTIVPVPAESLETFKNETLTSALLGHPVSLPTPSLKARRNDIEAAHSWLQHLGLSDGPFFVACVGNTENPARNWKSEGWAEVLRWAIKHFDASAVLIGTPEEHSSTESVRGMLGPLREKAFNSCDHPGGIDVLLGVIALSKGYIGRDTGPMHMAAALGKTVISVFGGGDWPRFLPNASTGAVVTARVPCEGCGWLCRFPEPYCIRLVPAQAVIAAATKIRFDEFDNFMINTLDSRELAPPDVLERLIAEVPSANLPDSTVATSHSALSPTESSALNSAIEARWARWQNASTQVEIAQIKAMIQSQMEAIRIAVSATVQHLASAAINDAREVQERQIATATAELRLNVTSLEETVSKLRSSEAEARAEVTRLQGEIARLGQDRLKSEQREAELSVAVTRATAECQSLRMHNELERYRRQVQLADLAKPLTMATTEIAGLHATIRQLLAERTSRVPQVSECDNEYRAQMAARLQEAENQCAHLRHEIETSLALRAARSLTWVLSPIRKAIVGNQPGTQA